MHKIIIIIQRMFHMEAVMNPRSGAYLKTMGPILWGMTLVSSTPKIIIKGLSAATAATAATTAAAKVKKVKKIKEATAETALMS